MRAIGYVRVSTEEQQREGVSLDLQERDIRLYCELNHLDLIEVVRDEGVSAKDMNRKGIQRILPMINKKEIDAIVVWKLDRISRNTIDSLMLINNLEKKSVAFHSISERIDTKTPSGMFFITLLSALAQMERDMISERTGAALRFKRSKGGCAGNSPYGYRTVGKRQNSKLVIVEEEMKILSRIKIMRSGRVSYNGIATHLNIMGVKTRSGGKWYAETIKSILQHSLP